jgi:hypothetical protein
MADASYSLDPLLEALSSQYHHLPSSSGASSQFGTAAASAEAGLTILRPPILSSWSHRSLKYPRARSYERGWVLHPLSSSSTASTSPVSPREWHEFMLSVQANLWKFQWTQFALLTGPLCLMAILDLTGHITEKIFFALLGLLVLGGIPSAAYNRHRFHHVMDHLVNEWRLKFLEHGWIVEYQRQTVVRLLWGYWTWTESFIVFHRQDHEPPTQV